MSREITASNQVFTTAPKAVVSEPQNKSRRAA